MTTRTMALLAHQGGWDEILLVAGPILVIVALIVVVKKRLDRSISLRHGDIDALNQGAESDKSSD
ncbi:MAG: hypothetical protein EXQ66_06395 [Ilumatobacteraceae bacterium]|nr:hypothetical protein [Ilumatobacteraceae bacterium]